ncbi:MAG: chaplin family protein [Natronosporangium sp.]
MRNSLNIGALTAGALLASGAAAQASPTMTTTDNLGVLNGTQALLPVQAPIDICGNAVAAAGAAFAACEGGAAAALDPEWTFDHYRSEQASGGPTLTSTGNTGIGNGTQLYAPIQVPIDVCGNAVAVLGAASGSCTGGASASQHGGKPGEQKPGKPSYGYDRTKPAAEGADQADQAQGADQAEQESAAEPKAEVVAASSTGGTTMTSSGNVGLLNGTQALVPVQLPINICGNAIAILGTAQAECEGGAKATNRL